MKKLLARRPSPALIVAFIALFVALSGISYAAKRIGSGGIKKNAITASKIKKNAVTKSKIKKDNVTGDKILESSLGKVPDADKLDGQDSAAYEKSNKNVRIAKFDLGNNETKTIYTQGPFALTARCRINQDILAVPAGSDDVADISISTSQDNAAFDANDSTADLDTTTVETSREFVLAGDATGTAFIDQEGDGTAIAPDGTQFIAQLWGGVNILNQPGRCSFGGFVNQIS